MAAKKLDTSFEQIYASFQSYKGVFETPCITSGSHIEP
jgi:hypothetical protein